MMWYYILSFTDIRYVSQMRNRKKNIEGAVLNKSINHNHFFFFVLKQQQQKHKFWNIKQLQVQNKIKENKKKREEKMFQI